LQSLFFLKPHNPLMVCIIPVECVFTCIWFYNNVITNGVRTNQLLPLSLPSNEILELESMISHIFNIAVDTR